MPARTQNSGHTQLAPNGCCVATERNRVVIEVAGQTAAQPSPTGTPTVHRIRDQMGSKSRPWRFRALTLSRWRSNLNLLYCRTTDGFRGAGNAATELVHFG